MDERKNTSRISNLDIAETHDYTQDTNWSGYHHNITPRSKPHKQQRNNNQKPLAKIYEPARSLRHENMQAMPIPAVAQRKPVKPDRRSTPRVWNRSNALVLAMQPLDTEFSSTTPINNRFSQCSGSRWETRRLEVAKKSRWRSRETDLCRPGRNASTKRARKTIKESKRSVGILPGR